jgi:hypothetical protein
MSPMTSGETVMSSATRTGEPTLADYYRPLQDAAAAVAAQRPPSAGRFEVPFALPELDSGVAHFLPMDPRQVQEWSLVMVSATPAGVIRGAIAACGGTD